MKIAALGLGMWGFCLARHLALQGHEVRGWEKNEKLFRRLQRGEDHPHLLRSARGLSLTLHASLEEAVHGAEYIIESVTTKGVRPVLEELKALRIDLCPLVLTSKGIEEKSFLTTPAIAEEILGEGSKEKIAILSGPSFAQEVARNLPTAVVCGAHNIKLAEDVATIFSSKTFRVYPNHDMKGVALGGALKNIVAIACGIADGLELGVGAKASLVTRGLHEMVKLSLQEGCSTQTLYGLSGLGDLYLTCSSIQSRNFRFGKLLSEKLTQQEAEHHIGMVVEGAFTCRAAKELAHKHNIEMPITETIVDILDGKIDPKDAVRRIMQRDVKEEHL